MLHSPRDFSTFSFLVPLTYFLLIFVTTSSNTIGMSTSKPKSVSSPFPMSEQELHERMKYAKPLTREQFIQRLKEIKSAQNSRDK